MFNILILTAMYINYIYSTDKQSTLYVIYSIFVYTHCCVTRGIFILYNNLSGCLWYHSLVISLSIQSNVTLWRHDSLSILVLQVTPLSTSNSSIYSAVWRDLFNFLSSSPSLISLLFISNEPWHCGKGGFDFVLHFRTVVPLIDYVVYLLLSYKESTVRECSDTVYIHSCAYSL